MQPSKNQAQAVGEALQSKDLAGKHLGLRLLEIRPGYAQVSITIRPDMVNGHGICHGGVTYTLADTAFAYASNARNEKSVALHCSINYTNPVYVDDQLIATGSEQTLKGRHGIYDVTVTNQNEQIVALFRGQAYRTQENAILF